MEILEEIKRQKALYGNRSAAVKMASGTLDALRDELWDKYHAHHSGLRLGALKIIVDPAMRIDVVRVLLSWDSGTMDSSGGLW